MKLLRYTSLVLLLAAVLLTMAILVAPHIAPLRDFDQTFYPAIRYTLAGENPYTAYYEETDQGAPPDFFSPPWLLLILLPFGFFPLAIARALWVLLLVGVTLGAISLLRPWGLTGLKPLLLVILPWSLIGILFGQVAAIVLLGTLLAIREAWRSDRTIGSGLRLLLGLLLVSVKPQLGLFVALPLLIQMVWQRDSRLKLLVVAGLFLLIPTLAITPPWLVSKAIEVQQVTAPLWKSTLEREMLLWQAPLWLAHLMRLLVLATMGLWAWHQCKLTPAWWSAWLAAVLIIPPYTRAYDGVLLLPLLGQMLVYRRWYFVAFITGMAAYVSLPIGELGSVVAPLLAWLLFVPWSVLWQRPINSQPIDQSG